MTFFDFYCTESFMHTTRTNRIIYFDKGVKYRFEYTTNMEGYLCYKYVRISPRDTYWFEIDYINERFITIEE